MKIIVLILVFLIVFAAGVLVDQVFLKGQMLSSVSVTNEYKATTTPLAEAWTDRRLNTGPGVLGSVVITSQGTVAFDLLDSLDAGRNTATGTLVSIPRNATVGTYTFDVEYNEGLYLDVIEGTLGTSTITYR